MPTIRTFLVLSFAGSALALASPPAMAADPVGSGADDGAPLVGDFEGTPGVDDATGTPLSPEEQRDAPLVGDFEGTSTEGGSDPRTEPAEGDPLPGGDPVAPSTGDETVAVRMVAANSSYRASYRRAARHHHRHGHHHLKHAR